MQQSAKIKKKTPYNHFKRKIRKQLYHLVLLVCLRWKADVHCHVAWGTRTYVCLEQSKREVNYRKGIASGFWSNNARKERNARTEQNVLERDRVQTIILRTINNLVKTGLSRLGKAVCCHKLLRSSTASSLCYSNYLAKLSMLPIFVRFFIRHQFHVYIPTIHDFRNSWGRSFAAVANLKLKCQNEIITKNSKRWLSFSVKHAKMLAF